MCSVRLTRKLAASLNGFNLTQIGIGDVLELPDQTANMLITEGWAEPLMKKPKDRVNDEVAPQRQRSPTKRPLQVPTTLLNPDTP